MPRLITLTKTRPISELVELMLTEELKRPVACSPSGKVFFKYPLQPGNWDQIHVGSWMIRGDKLVAFITEEVEDNSPTQAA